MAIWAIGDTHLSLSVDKSMHIFGAGWEDYVERLRQNWSTCVSDEDTVLILGDISWGMKPEEAVADLTFLHKLPGRRKILLRGNHDYWWTTRRRVDQIFEENNLHTLEIFQNEALLLEENGQNILLTGSRGWKNPMDDDFTDDDNKVYKRELERLKLSLREGNTMAQAQSIHKRLAITHYPPIQRDGRLTEFAKLLVSNQVDLCCYGHVHGLAARQAYEGTVDGCSFMKVSADYLGFRPKKLFPIE